jgi:peptide/nickel transport system permease protein
MVGFIVRRLFLAIPILVGISVLVFLLTRLAPGDPAAFFVDQSRADPAVMDRVRVELGLDQPLPVQYLAWAGRVLHGDLGYSFTYQTQAWDVIALRIPLTLQLQLAANVVALAVSIPAGVLSAVRYRSVLDYSVTVGTLFRPVRAGLLVRADAHFDFLGRIGLVPLRPVPAPTGGLERLKYFVLPTVVLALAYVAAFTRFMHASLLDVIRGDYVTTARAKGLTQPMALYGHALKNALIPVITIIGNYLPRLIGGSIIVETVFAWPGIGRLVCDAAFRRDYPVIMGLALVTGLTIVLLNIVVDLLYVWPIRGSLSNAAPRDLRPRRASAAERRVNSSSPAPRHLAHDHPPPAGSLFFPGHCPADRRRRFCATHFAARPGRTGPAPASAIAELHVPGRSRSVRARFAQSPHLRHDDFPIGGGGGRLDPDRTRHPAGRPRRLLYGGPID